MKSRRLFLVNAAALTVAYRTAAAQSRKTWRLGYLSPATPDDDVLYFQAFREALSAQGYVEGSNLVIDRRLASGVELLPGLAAELVARNVDVIVAITTPAARAAKTATDAIPIVFVGPSDPVGSGLVSTLARPGANVTGMTDQGVDLAGKRLELLKQLVPRLKRVAALGAPTDPVWEPVWSEVQVGARRLGIDMTPMLMMTPDQLRVLFADLDRSVQALYVAPQAILWVHRKEIIKLAARARLPAVYEIRVIHSVIE